MVRSILSNNLLKVPNAGGRPRVASEINRNTKLQNNTLWFDDAKKVCCGDRSNYAAEKPSHAIRQDFQIQILSRIKQKNMKKVAKAGEKVESNSNIT